ncbi:MAG: hypothetical protein U0905_02365 [Pirellulales bacterium]
MKAILIVLTLLVVLLALGWITFRSDPQRPSLELRTDKVKSDVKRILQETRDRVNTPHESAPHQDGPVN